MSRSLFSKKKAGEPALLVNYRSDDLFFIIVVVIVVVIGDFVGTFRYGLLD